MIRYIDLFARYIIIGVLSAYLLIYGLRPVVPYPEYILEIGEHYWMLLIMVILNYYLAIWDLKIGLLFALCLIALIFDLFIFAK
jgi:hypothetical protein